MNLKPNITELLRFRSGETVAVPKATPTFSVWKGPAISSTYGGKAVLNHNGRPAFAELIILWSLTGEGWQGAWVTHAGGREIYRTGLMDAAPLRALPEPLSTRLKDIRDVRGTSKGTWDVSCYKDGQFLFVESKRKGHDSIKSDQVDWLKAALETGLQASSFLVVEWSTDEPVPTTRRVRKIPSREHFESTHRSLGEVMPAVSGAIDDRLPPNEGISIFPAFEAGAAGRLRHWREANPDSFVVNLRGLTDAVFHIAKCHTLAEPWPDHTPRPNTKFGADNLHDLKALAAGKGWRARDCGYCARRLRNT